MREVLNGKNDIALVAANETQKSLLDSLYNRKKAANLLFANIVPQCTTIEDIDGCLPLEVVIYSSVSTDGKAEKLEQLALKGQIAHLIVLKTSADGDYGAEEVFQEVNKKL